MSRRRPPSSHRARHAPWRPRRQPFQRYVVLIFFLHVIVIAAFALKWKNDKAIELEMSSAAASQELEPEDIHWVDSAEMEVNQTADATTSTSSVKDPESQIAFSPPPKPDPPEVKKPEPRPEPKPEPVPEPKPTPRKEIKLTPAPKPAPPRSAPKLVAYTPPPAPKPVPKPKVAKLSPAPKPKPVVTPRPKPKVVEKPKPKVIEKPKVSPKPAPAPSRPIVKAVPYQPNGSKATPIRPSTSGNRGGSGASSRGSGGSAPRKFGDIGEYHLLVKNAFHSRWSQPRAMMTSGIKYRATARIVIGRDGKIQSWRIVKSSGHPEMDKSVEDALRRVTKIDPLPEFISGPSYTVHLNFDI